MRTIYKHDACLNICELWLMDFSVLRHIKLTVVIYCEDVAYEPRYDGRRIAKCDDMSREDEYEIRRRQMWTRYS